MWKYRIGDVVSHRVYPDLKGIIIQQKISYEIDPDIDGRRSWYVIRWFSQPSYLVTTGKENEDQLILIEHYVDV